MTPIVIFALYCNYLLNLSENWRGRSEEAMGSAPGGLRRVSKRRWLVSYTDKEGKGISSRA